MNYAALLHSHALFWALALLLFGVALLLHSKGKKKGAKITQMILRLMYVLLLFTGIYMIVLLGFQYMLIIKGILAIGLIYTMEMILVRGSKGTFRGNQRMIYWAAFLILLIVVLILGYGKF
jgi:uncharacterized membrane protein SirB2